MEPPRYMRDESIHASVSRSPMTASPHAWTRGAGRLFALRVLAMQESVLELPTNASSQAVIVSGGDQWCPLAWPRHRNTSRSPMNAASQARTVEL